MTAFGRRHRRDERGVTIVEAVFVLPVLFLLVLGLFDLGQWVLQGTQLSAGARDGARAGILSYKTAAGTTAAPGGADFATIDNAVRARLAGQAYSMTVACVGASDEVSKSCASAMPDVDRLKVSLSFTRSPLSLATSPFGPQAVTGISVMQLVGRPQ